MMGHIYTFLRNEWHLLINYSDGIHAASYSNNQILSRRTKSTYFRQRKRQPLNVIEIIGIV